MLRMSCVVLAVWGGQAGAQDQCRYLGNETVAQEVCQCGSVENDIARLQCFDEVNDKPDTKHWIARLQVEWVSRQPFGPDAIRQWVRDNE